jgi:hypothetical protein
MGSMIQQRSGGRKLVHSPIVVYHQIQEDWHAVKILQFRHGSRQAP